MHSSLSHAASDREECGHPLSSDSGGSSVIPPHPQRPANSRMRKLFPSHKASKHTGIQVVYIQTILIRSETFQSETHRRQTKLMTRRLFGFTACSFFLTQVSDWEAVVYGKTEDQLIMTEQARQYLNPYPAPGSTSRALVL